MSMSPPNGESKVTNYANRIPWAPIITIIGWIAVGIAFYATTTRQLSEQEKQIEQIVRARERFLEQVNLRIDRVSDALRAFEERVDRLDTPLAKKVEGMANLQNVLNDRINGIGNNINSLQVTNTARFETFQKQIDLLEKKSDQMIQALDAQYNALNDHLRSHGGSGGIPRR